MGTPPTAVLIGGMVATAVTSTAVVYFAGRDDRHDDSIVTTAVGAAGAGLLGAAIGSPLWERGHLVLGVVTMAGVTATGATIGFHLGRSAKKRGLEIVPTASSGFTGAVLGGTF
jgi:predicted permease